MRHLKFDKDRLMRMRMDSIRLISEDIHKREGVKGGAVEQLALNISSMHAQRSAKKPSLGGKFLNVIKKFQ